MFKIAALSCAGLTVFGASGCKVTECTETSADGGTTKKENCLQLEPTVEYQDMRKRTGEQAWTSGQPISVTNRNGKLTVAPGAAGDERVLFSGIPFTRETNNADGAQKAKDHLGAMADPAFTGAGFISLIAPGGGVDGYHLTVWIPLDFDAALTLRNDNGTTELHGVDGTASTTVVSHAIDATNLTHTINLHATVGDIQARGVPSGAGNVIRTDLGDVNATIGAANLTITAKTDSGAVTFPMGWMSAVATDKLSGSATLGDGSGMLNVSSGGGQLNFFAQ
jgi:hypothetical protein